MPLGESHLIHTPAAVQAAAAQLGPPATELEVVFNNVSCSVPKSVVDNNLSQKLSSILHRSKTKNEAMDSQPNMKQVLFDVSGRASPGEVLALMGPSGSSKTSLLSIIGGRAQSAVQHTGEVLFNGGPLTKSTKRQVGYVMQDDLFFQDLTVYETLYFAAMLRLPSHMTKAEKIERVDGVISALGLSQCRDTIIGGFFRRGVSGGERKRVSVGHELLINPALILLDEPTSGLDSTTAHSLMVLLSSLAKTGRAIITTIHQPSSRLYQELDTVMLLSQGHVAYYGAASAAAEWFEHLGYPLQLGVNIADFILDLSSGEIPKSADGEAERLRLIQICEAYLRQHPDGYQSGSGIDIPALLSDGSNGHVAGEESPLIKANGTVMTGSNLIALEAKKSRMLRSQTSIAAMKPGASRWGASYWTQLNVLFIRSVRTRRFESLTVQDMSQFIIVGAVCGMIWWQIGQGETVADAQNALGLLFFESLFLAFRTMFVALFTFPNEHKMMLKERASGMYRLSAFYIARSTSDLPVDFAIPTVFIILIYTMGGLRSGWAFFANWSAVLLNTLVAQSFGLLIGATVMAPKTAQTIAGVIMLTCMLVGGFYVSNIPAWIGWLKWLSFMTYIFNLQAKIEYSGRTLYDCANVINVNDPSTDCPQVDDLQKALKLPTDPNAAPWEAGVLMAYLFVFRILVYVALRYKTSAGGSGRR